MEQQIDINIKKVNVKEVAKTKKITLYTCVYWLNNGTMFSNMPSENKRYQEEYAFSMSKNGGYSCIYSFEVETPF